MPDWRIGDKVVCVDNSGGKIPYTLGKTYIIDLDLSVICDLGIGCFYARERFMPLYQYNQFYRKEKLRKINESNL